MKIQPGAASQAANRRARNDARACKLAGKTWTADMTDCVARFCPEWNQLGVKLCR